MTDTPGDMAAKLEEAVKVAQAINTELWWCVNQLGCNWKDAKWRADSSVGRAYDASVATLADLRAAASMLRECAEREKALREALHEIAKCEIEYSDGVAACYGPPVLSAEQMAATAFAALSLNNNARAK